MLINMNSHSFLKRVHTIRNRFGKIVTDRSGYTLLEIMIVMVIIGILLAIIVPRVMDLPDKGRVQKAKSDIAGLSLALSRYKLDTGLYPTTEDGLDALINKPSSLSESAAQNYNESGYLDKKTLPKDPWGNPYSYRSPGDNNADYEIICYGADGKEGGTGINADIKSGDN
jgi:general secretion pathway protein G